jgi:hypothetical protein
MRGGISPPPQSSYFWLWQTLRLHIYFVAHSALSQLENPLLGVYHAPGGKKKVVVLWYNVIFR